MNDPIGTNVVSPSSVSSTSRIRAYVELLRVSNLPTVFSNVLVGAALGADGGDMPWEVALPCVAAVVCFYFGGVALNDAVDVNVDRIERPERPVPSGRLSAAQAYTVAIVTFALGLGVLASISPAALGMGVVLLAVITAYDFLHKRFPPSVFFMGAARGMVYLTAAAAVAWPLDLHKPLWFIGTIAAYTIAFTIVARSENKAGLDSGRWIAAGIPLIVLIPGVWIKVDEVLTAGVAAILLTLWQARAVLNVFQLPPEIKTAVHIWLSGFCLMDAFYLSFLGNVVLAAIAFGCFLATLLLQRRFMGT